MLEDLALNESIETVPLRLEMSCPVGLILSSDSVPLGDDLGDFRGKSVEFWGVVLGFDVGGEGGLDG